MRKIIEYTLVSVDGVFSNPAGDGFMGYRDDAYLRDGLGQPTQCDAMIMGRVFYDGARPSGCPAPRRRREFAMSAPFSAPHGEGPVHAHRAFTC